MRIVKHGPAIYEVFAANHHGFFASMKRAQAWGEARMAGKPYNPIPKAGEA
jgi:hypothetical protein